jgi:hypothetical protein
MVIMTFTVGGSPGCLAPPSHQRRRRHRPLARWPTARRPGLHRANGLPSDGTLSLGGSLIAFTGLEYVGSVAPRVTAVQLSAAVLNENDVVTLSGDFLDPGSLSGHTITVSWGDGVADAAVSLPVGARSFSLSHRYRDDDPSGTPADSYTVTVTVTDDEALTDAAATPVTVNNVAPVLTERRAARLVASGGGRGRPHRQRQLHRRGTRDAHTAPVDWGDGSVTTRAQITETGGSGCLLSSHVYAPAASTRVTLSDDDTARPPYDRVRHRRASFRRMGGPPCSWWGRPPRRRHAVHQQRPD